MKSSLLLVFFFPAYVFLQNQLVCYNFASNLDQNLLPNSCGDSEASLHYTQAQGQKFCLSQGCTLGNRGFFHSEDLNLGQSFTLLLWSFSFQIDKGLQHLLQFVSQTNPIFGLDSELYTGTMVYQAGCQAQKAQVGIGFSQGQAPLMWTLLYLKVEPGELELGIFNPDVEVYGFEKSRVLTSVCPKSNNSIFNLEINHIEPFWEGVVNEIQLYSGILSEMEIVRATVYKNYPRILYKGNYIGNQYNFDFEFRDGIFENFAREVRLTLRVGKNAKIGDNGISSSSGPLFKIKGFPSQGPLYLESWFKLDQLHTFTAFQSSFIGKLVLEESQATLTIKQESTTISISQVQGKWHFVSLENFFIEPRESKTTTSSGLNNLSYFSFDSSQSQIIASESSLRYFELKVGEGLMGWMNRFKMSYSPRGRNALLYFGANTPQCSRGTFYNGKECQDCLSWCSKCLTTASSQCIQQTSISSFTRICQENQEFIPSAGICITKPPINTPDVHNCSVFQQQKCIKCKSGFKIFLGECLQTCPEHKIQTETQCVDWISYSGVALQNNNELLFTYSQKVRLNGSFLDFITKELKISFSKPVAYLLKAQTPLGSLASQIRIKIQVLDTIFSSESVEQNILIQKRDENGDKIQGQNQKFSSQLKPQNSPQLDQDIQTFSQATQITVATIGAVLGINLVVPILLDLSLKFLWSLINTAQLLQYFLMICIPKPYNLIILLQNLSFANGDFMIFEVLGEKLSFDFINRLNQLYPEQLFACFEEAGFESDSFILNQETTMYIVGIYFLLLIPSHFALAMVFRPCKSKCATKLHNKFKSVYQCDSLERLLLQIYLELVISTFIGLQQLQFSNSDERADSIVRLLCLLIFIFGYPFYQIRKLFKVLRLLKQPGLAQDQKKKHTQAAEELRSKLMFLLNRISFSFVVVFMRNAIVIELFMLMILFTAQVILLFFTKFIKSRLQRIELIIENLLLLALVIILSVFKHHYSDWDDQIFIGVGYVPVGLILMSFVVGIGVLLYKTITACKKKCRRKRRVMPKFMVKPKQTEQGRNKPNTTAYLTSEKDEQGDRMTTGEGQDFRAIRKVSKRRLKSALPTDRYPLTKKITSRSLARRLFS